MNETWLLLARDARLAASSLATNNRYRSCVSRAYYAAYSKVTFELITSANVTMLKGREGPSHIKVRTLIEVHLFKQDHSTKFRLSQLMGRLYTLRVDADYKPSVIVQGREAREAISIMNTIFDVF